MGILIKSVFLVLLLIKFSYAQDITGRMEGRVVDTTGISLYGVNISLQSESLQGLLGTSTDDKGYFRILLLPIGSYKVKISFVGYREITFENVQISLGKTSNLGEIKLKQQAYNLPNIIISGEKQFIDPSSTTYGGNLRSNDFENLPVERNYQSMISLLPQSNLSYYGDGVNIGGATGFENKYFVDGVEVTDPLFAVFSTYLPYNFIKEVEVKAGGYEAEFQSALGGVINVVTNSGTNQFHGSAFGFYTNNSFIYHKQLGLLDPTQGDFSDYDIGLSLGGPIIQNELWFFAAYNPTFSNHEVSVPDFGIGVDKTLRHSFAGKLKWLASQQLRINLTVTGDPTVRDAVGRNVLNPPTGLGNPDVYLQYINEGGVNISLNGSYSVGQNFLLDGFIARVIRHDTGEPSTERGNEILFNDWTNDTQAGGVGVRWDSFRYSNIAKVSFSILSNVHQVRVGIQYKVNGTDNQFDYHNIIKQNDTTYQENVGNGFQTVSQRIPSFFVQDSWKIFNNLRAFVGIRWDGQYIIGSNDKVDQTVTVPLQPRIGIIFIPDNTGKNKIFGSFGRYSQELNLGKSTGFYSDQGYDSTFFYPQDPRISKNGVSIAPWSASHIIFPEVEDLRGQYYDEFSLGYERLVGKNLRIGVQGVYRILREAIDDAYVLSEGRFRIGNPGRGILSDFPRPERNYKALIFTIEQHFDEHFNFLASYVLSRDYGNYEGLFDAIAHGEFPNQNWSNDNPFLAPIKTTGLLPNDRTHLFKFSGAYSFEFGLTTGITLTAQSGTPLSELWDTGYGLSFLSDRGAMGRTSTLWDLNARFVYKVAFLNIAGSRLILDIFHIASKQQPVDINQFHYYDTDENGNPSVLNSNYGKTYRYQQPMSVRLGMEINF